MTIKTAPSAVTIAFLFGCALFAQSTTPLRFDSASVKANLRPIPAGSTGNVLPLGGGRLRAEAGAHSPWAKTILGLVCDFDFIFAPLF